GLTRALGSLAGPLAFGAPGASNLLARLDSALIGTGSVWLIFGIGRALFTREVGLLGALFLTVSFLHVRDSHYGVNDVPATGLLLLSLYFSAQILRNPRHRWYLLAGLARGLATSTKYSMGFSFVPLLFAHLVARWANGGDVLSRPSRDRRKGVEARVSSLVSAGWSSGAGH